MKVGLLGLSNPCDLDKVLKVKELFIQKGYECTISYLVDKKCTASQRAEIFNQWMSMDFDEIFDVSGGDLANETIPYLNLEVYKKSRTLFYGYSDLTCVLNVLYPIRPCCLFQVRNNDTVDTDFLYEFKQGNKINGIVVGGNIRCLLKLAGTSYFPDCTGKVLFLESLSGNENRIRAFFAQLSMMGVFNQIQGLILGQFTELDAINREIDFYKDYYNGPVARTKQIGHAKNSKAIWIGKEVHLCNEEN